jgi:hypothetical protein
MQFLAGKIKFHDKPDASSNPAATTASNNGLDVEEITASMVWTVESYMPHNNNEYKATKALVVLLDTPKNVPTNKAGEQQKRANGTVIMDESLFMRCDRGDSRRIGSMLKWSLNGETIWRSNNTKFHLYASITQEVLKIRPPGILKLVLDDGVDINRDLYTQRAEEMIRDHAFEDRSTYEQECLIANLSRHNFTERFVIRGEEGQGLYNNTVERLPQTDIGEADVKIPRFIKRDGTTKHYIVVSQDTDLIFILLLHLKGLGLPESRKDDEDDDFELLLDSQKPQDRRQGYSAPYRFLDIKALYYEILTLFAREYPTVKNPIETLIFLVYSGKTDYTTNFETCLKVTPRVVWNTFSSLHTDSVIFRERGYLTFNDAMYDEQTIIVTEKKTKEKESAKMGQKRSTERLCPYPLHLRNVLSEAVSYTYDLESDLYNITLDDVRCQSFLYLLCQFKVIDDLAALGHTQFNKKSKQRTYIPTADELFMWISSIEAQVELHRSYTNINSSDNDSKKRKAVELSFIRKTTIEEVVPQKNKRPKLLQRYPPKSTITAIGTVATESPGLIEKKVITLEDMECDFNEALKQSVKPTKMLQLEPRQQKSAVIELIDDIEEIEIERQEIRESAKPVLIGRPVTTLTVRRKLDTLCKKQLPKQYGVPNLQAMLARICRTCWIMNYHQNGWKTPAYMTNFSDAHYTDPTLSLYGWKAEEIVQNEENIRQGVWNNSYYTSVYDSTLSRQGVIPFRVFKMTETSLVYNKSYARYSIGSL